MSMSKQSVQDQIDELQDLLDQESKVTAVPGNPYITSISGRLGGMRTVLNDPLYGAAPDMLEALEGLSQFVFYGIDETKLSALGKKWVRQAHTAIAKARGL